MRRQYIVWNLVVDVQCRPGRRWSSVLPNNEMSFASLNLAQPLMRAIADAGYTKPTPVQAQAIPLVLAGGDLLAGAGTGPGQNAGLPPPLPAPPSAQPRP